MPNDLLGEIHSSTATTPSPDWVDFRSEVTGMYLLSGQGNGEWEAQHLIREYNRNINSLYKSWTGTEPNTTGLFLEPYNAGFSYQGTGDFRDYKWDTYSLQFDGVDDFVETEADDTLATKTYSFWANSSDTSTRGPIFHHGARTQGCLFFNYVAGRPFLFLGASQLRYWADTTAQDDGAWHHWALYLDHTSTSDCELYVDGVLQTVLGTVESGPFDAYSSGIAIGGSVAVTAMEYFDGSIDEFAIFDGELSPAQIVAIYNGGTPESVASYNPDAWWRMGDGDTFPTLQDSSTNNYTGTMQNMDAADIVADTP